MGHYDEAILQRVRVGGKTELEIAREIGVSRALVSKVKRKYGMSTPRPEYDQKILPIVPLTDHQRQYGYVMLKRLEKKINGGELTTKQAEELASFRRGLAKKVWIYEPDGEGFRQIKRLPEHKNYPFYPPPE